MDFELFSDVGKLWNIKAGKDTHAHRAPVSLGRTGLQNRVWVLFLSVGVGGGHSVLLVSGAKVKNKKATKMKWSKNVRQTRWNRHISPLILTSVSEEWQTHVLLPRPSDREATRHPLWQDVPHQGNKCGENWAWRIAFWLELILSWQKAKWKRSQEQSGTDVQKLRKPSAVWKEFFIHHASKDMEPVTHDVWTSILAPVGVSK